MKKLFSQIKQKTKMSGSDLAVVAMFAAGLFLLGYKVLNQPTSNTALSRTSVMIVRSDKRSGGSGVILSSSPSKSTILTNSHVCGVIQNGGVVIRGGEEHAVVSYKHSRTHDLCLITVAADLGVNTVVAKSAPQNGDYTAVVGHPHLLPTVVTRGHFSSHQIVEIMTKVRECTDADIQADPDNAFLCMFLGGIPVITRYEAQVITALIQPGSSGSPVYNSAGEISGLVFAGSSDIGYGLIVPFESVNNFLNEESSTIAPTLANNSFEVTAALIKGGKAYASDPTMRERLETLCSDSDAKTKEAVKTICNILGKDLLWRN